MVGPERLPVQNLQTPKLPTTNKPDPYSVPVGDEGWWDKATCTLALEKVSSHTYASPLRVAWCICREDTGRPQLLRI